MIEETQQQPKIAFFGTSGFAQTILMELLSQHKIFPSLIITTPDKPVGRKQIITASPVKKWALENTIPVFQPDKLKDPAFLETLGKDWDIFIVASYGKIIPQLIIDIPRYGTINIHPSLLPLYRGATPLQSQIKNDEKNMGTTIMMMDREVDHGPIIAQRNVEFTDKELPPTFSMLETIMAIESAELLKSCLPALLKNELTFQEQDHQKATFTHLLKKEDGEIDFDPTHPELSVREHYLHYLAYEEWPGTFFFIQKENIKMRVIIKKAAFINEKFTPQRVVPEGKKEIDYSDFIKTL